MEAKEPKGAETGQCSVDFDFLEEEDAAQSSSTKPAATKCVLCGKSSKDRPTSAWTLILLQCLFCQFCFAGHLFSSGFL